MRLKLIALIAVLFVLAGCSAETGTLEFRANGEDFVRQGFISKDGWQIQFDSLNVSLSDMAAYRTEGSYDASTGEMPDGPSVTLSEAMIIDLAAGGPDAMPILAGSVEAEAGHYDAISWTMANADGPTLELIGSAEKDGETIQFDIEVNESYSYSCGEFVGDERTGFVDAGTTDDVEMTFHFDHVFGDIDTPADDNLNVGAVGFSPLAALASGGQLNTSLEALATSMNADDYAKLIDTLATLGHVGEGHCYEETNGYTDYEG